VTEFLVSQAELGLRAQKLEIVKEKSIVLITWAGLNSSLSSLLLNSLTDVVPAEKLKWKYDPLLAFENGEGNIYGRGAQDMKSVGVQYLESIRALKSSGYQLTRSVHLSYVPYEGLGAERGWLNLCHHLSFSSSMSAYAWTNDWHAQRITTESSLARGRPGSL
jgi:acetylornithine deacetylase/succinyl-diaminopimelate desuccinylase-like protein